LFDVRNLTMSSQDYVPVPSGENEKDSRSTYQPRRTFTITPTSMCISICLLALTLIAFTAGMKVGQTWEAYHHDHKRVRGDGLLDPQTFIGSSKSYIWPVLNFKRALAEKYSTQKRRDV
jgi:hypothetical protein